MKDNQHEQLFTELTSEEAAVVEGGKLLLNTTVNFDTVLYSRSFKNNIGTKIVSAHNTHATGAAKPSNTSYKITLQRLTGGKFLDIEHITLPINWAGDVTWPGVSIGDTLRFKFNDEQDGKKITGSLKVYD
jgi:hypothetical protein